MSHINDWVSKDAIPGFLLHLSTNGASDSTVSKYESVFLQFLQSVQPVDALRPEDFLTWLGIKRAYGAAASTLKLYLAAGKSYAKFAGSGLDTLSAYRLPPLPEPTPHPLPNGMSDVRAMLAMCPRSPKTRVLIGLTALAGLRVNEAVEADVTDIQTRTANGERYLVLVVKGKGERVREVPISSELARILGRRGPGKLVGLTNDSARNAVTRCAARAGVTGHDGGTVSSHDLRATFATALYEATKDIVLVQRALGHSNVKTTQVYIGTAPSRTLAAVNAL